MSESVIAGRNNVMAALEGERSVVKILVAKTLKGNLEKLLNAAKAKGCPVQFVPREKVDEAAPGLNHQGIVAITAAWSYLELDELIAQQNMKENPVLLLLAGVEDPHNLGSLLRTSACAGVTGIIIPKRRSAQLTETVARVSMGAIETVPVARVGNLAQALERLKAAGFWAAAADMDGKSVYHKLAWNFPTVLILGGEGEGVPRLLKETSDYTISIPIHGRVGSLNVAVAGAVVLFEIKRQRDLAHELADN